MDGGAWSLGPWTSGAWLPSEVGGQVGSATDGPGHTAGCVGTQWVSRVRGASREVQSPPEPDGRGVCTP